MTTFEKSVTFPAQLPDVSWGRNPSDNNKWYKYDAPTLGAAKPLTLESDVTLTAVFEEADAHSIPSAISSNTTLDKTDVPYVATGDISVAKGATLTIAEDVTIVMPSRTWIYVQGRLLVKGSKEKPVRIRPDTANGAASWGAICYNGAEDTSAIEYAIIIGTTLGRDALNHNTFVRNNEGIAVYGKAFFIGAFMVSAAMLSHAQYPDTAKIMTYNINAETHTDGDYTDIGDVVNEINPTIAGLQKVDSFSVTAAPVYVLKSLGEQTRMAYTFSKSYAKNNGSYGNGFLSDSVPNSTRHLAIPKGSASEDRSALEIGVTMADERVRVIVTHLDYASDANRIAQVQRILPWIDSGGSATDPVVIMADFNADETRESMKLLEEAGFVYVKGSKGEVLDTAQKINHILYRPENRWSVLGVGNPAYAASNRYPLWALMKLLNPVHTVTFPQDPCHSATRNRITTAGYRVELRLMHASMVSLDMVDISGRKIDMLLKERALCAGTHAFSMPKGIDVHGMAVIVATIHGSKLAKKVVLSQ